MLVLAAGKRLSNYRVNDNPNEDNGNAVSMLAEHTKVTGVILLYASTDSISADT
jgi:hypothetical protein